MDVHERRRYRKRPNSYRFHRERAEGIAALAVLAVMGAVFCAVMAQAGDHLWPIVAAAILATLVCGAFDVES